MAVAVAVVIGSRLRAQGGRAGVRRGRGVLLLLLLLMMSRAKDRLALMVMMLLVLGRVLVLVLSWIHGQAEFLARKIRPVPPFLDWPGLVSLAGGATGATAATQADGRSRRGAREHATHTLAHTRTASNVR